MLFDRNSTAARRLGPRARIGDLAAFREIAEEYGLVHAHPRFMTVVMDVSNKCNLKCRMCYFSFDRFFNAPPAFMTPETFSRVAGELLPHAEALTLSCGSEPLTCPHFPEILAVASRYQVPNVDFATNGLLLTPRLTEAVLDSGVNEIMFSVDAATRETYESIRRGGSFDRLLTNIRFLVKERERRGRSQPRLRFNMTLMRSNIREIEALVDLAADLGADDLDFRHLVVYKGLGTESESLVHDKELANRMLDRARAGAEKRGLKIVVCPRNFTLDGAAGPAPDAAPMSLRRERFLHPISLARKAAGRVRRLVSSWSRNPEPACRLPFRYILIDSLGRIRPCPHCHGEREYGRLGAKGGGAAAAWLGRPFGRLRSAVIRGRPPAMCRICLAQALLDPDSDEFFAPRSN